MAALIFSLIYTASEASSSPIVPLVLGHGMGDSCFDSSTMGRIVEFTKKITRGEVLCIPTGDNLDDDTRNGYFMNMDKNVDVFASKIAAQPALKDGFHALGFSQGNLLIRGYIHKYNNPPVRKFVSVHGPLFGVAGFPDCDPKGPLGRVCGLLDKILATEAYLPVTQENLFQANYYRDPEKIDSDEYRENSQIAAWNGEKNGTYPALWKSNFESLEKLVMIKAVNDTMVFPPLSEQFGFFGDLSFEKLVPMEEQDIFIKNIFGLKTLHNQGKIVQNETIGDHLKFSDEQYVWWLKNYIYDQQY